MIDDFKELLSEFNAEGVRYLVVGGYAVSLHAQPRATKDLDILIGYDSKNGEAVFRALARFGAPLENRSPADFAEAGKFFRMGAPPFMIDLMSDITGVDFEDAWSRRVAATVDAAAGLEAWFISADDLVTAKLAAGRAQDIADVEAIRAAATARK